MAINAYKTTSITNLDATPILRANPWVHGGNSKQFAGTIETGANDGVGSTYRMFRVGSWMRPVSFTLFCDQLGIAIDLGLYRAAADGGERVCQNLFAFDLDLTEGSRAGIPLRFDHDDIANVEKRIWDLLGLTADPNLEYDVTITHSGFPGVPAPGTLALQGAFSW